MLPSFGPCKVAPDRSLSLTLSQRWREVKSPSIIIASKTPFTGKTYQERHYFCPDKILKGCKTNGGSLGAIIGDEKEYSDHL